MYTAACSFVNPDPSPKNADPRGAFAVLEADRDRISADIEGFVYDAVAVAVAVAVALEVAAFRAGRRRRRQARDAA
jgi:hypothetical protein